MKMKFSTALAALLLFCFIVPAQAQKNAADTVFNDALFLYRSGNYPQAAELFNFVRINFPGHRLTPFAALYEGKSNLSGKEYLLSRNIFKGVLAEYRTGFVADEARMALAFNYLRIMKPDSAAHILINLINTTFEYSYIDSAKKYLRSVLLNQMNPEQIRKLSDFFSQSKAAAILRLTYGESLRLMSLVDSSNSVLASVIKDFPGTRESIIAAEIKQKPFNYENVAGTQYLLVMLPLFESKDSLQTGVAYNVLQGIQYATESFNATSDRKFALLIKDTQRDRLTIEKIYEEIKDVKGIVGIIGPLFSEECKDVIEVFGGMNVPIISPTATAPGLTEGNNCFIQANTSFEIGARGMAQYLRNIEKKEKIAVLNSSEGYSAILAEEFMKEFTRLGGSISARAVYSIKETDLHPAIQKLGKFRTEFEGIYAPISDPKAINPIILAIEDEELETPVYGNQDWSYGASLETNTVLLEKILLATDFFVEYQDEDYIRKSHEFAELTGNYFDRNAIYGYDAAMMFLRKFVKAGYDQKNFLLSVADRSEEKGLHKSFVFGPNRINRSLNIIRYNDGMFNLITKFNVE
jgi:ABC-type branched-subunit amino acid transport system substrate-binding protein